MKPESSNDLPKAKTRKQKWSFPFIWVVPVVAALVAGYLIYQRVHESGDTITIRFKDVDGLKPGQTSIQYRGADIGQVADIALSKDQQYANVQVKLRRYASAVAREGSVFWIVRPQLGMGNLTGLGTIISGPFIQVLPGKGKTASEFTGTETSPQLLDPKGLNVVLLSDQSGSLRAGVPIYYRGIEIGAVRETRLSTNATAVEIHGVIRRQFAPLIRNESKFWNVTGLDVRFGLFSGAEVNVESLKSLVMGGIAVATPDDPHNKSAPDGMIFRLYDKAEKDWLGWSPQITIAPDETEIGKPQVDASRELEFPQGNPP